MWATSGNQWRARLYKQNRGVKCEVTHTSTQITVFKSKTWSVCSCLYDQKIYHRVERSLIVWTGFIWFRIGISRSGLFWKW